MIDSVEGKTKEKKAEKNSVHIYCDGCCIPNPGKAGCGIAIYHKAILVDLHYGLYHEGTNNTAELNALFYALQLSEGDVKIFSDSLYSIKCITKWAFSWKQKCWKKSIKNLDIIKDAHKLYVEIQHRVEIKHVKGHSGIEGNELADRMAALAINEKRSEMRSYDLLDIESILAMESG